MATAHEKRILELAEKLIESNNSTKASPSDDVIDLLCEMEEAAKAYQKNNARHFLFTDHLRAILVEHNKEHPTSNAAVAYGCTLLAAEHLALYPAFSDEQACAYDHLAGALKALS